MMNMFRVLAAMLLAGLLAACGGGGGSAGATAGNPGGPGTTPPPAPTLALSLVTAAGVATTTVSTSTATFAKVTLADAAGVKVPGVVVTFSGGSGLVRFLPTSGTSLTDANGVATVEVQPLSVTAAGAGVLTATATVAGTALTGSINFAVPPTVSTEPSARVADYALFLDRTTLANGGTTTAKLSVIAVDSNNNIVSGATVVVSTDKNSVFIPNGSTTDATGTFTGQIGIGADKSNRTITATVTVNNKVKTTSLNVIGSRVVLQSTPSAPTPGQSATLTATVTDSAGNPAPNVVVTLSGTVASLAGQTATTDVTGVATKTYSAPASAGVYSIGASANGVLAAEYPLQVFSSTVPTAVIPGGAVPSLAALPNVLAVNTPGSSINRSTLRFLFLDSSNNPIRNVRVRFEDTTTGLPTVGASLASGASTLYTDTSGTVTTQYIAGQNPSPTNGVFLRACYKATDFTSTADCPNSIQATLTVAGQALAVSIGDDNLLERGTGTYIKRFLLSVADSAGRAVPNAPVDISVDLTHFGKGEFDFPTVVPPTALDASYPSPTTTPTAGTGRAWCRNEDHNRNGSVETGENLNGTLDTAGQGTLEPRKSDLIISYADPAVTTTNASGLLQIKIEYSQRFATWLSYRVRATASVAGSQGMAERLFVTSFIQGDQVNGSFLTPPYGFLACNSPN